MTNWVTIKVPEDDRDTAREYLDDMNDRRPEGKELTYGDAIVAGAERLNDRLDSDLEATATITPVLDEGALDGIRGDIEGALAEAGVQEFPTADVKEAVRAVIREEFPEGALR